MTSDHVRVAGTATRLRTVSHAFGVVVAAFVTGFVLAGLVAAVVTASGFGRESVVTLIAIFAAQFTGFGLVVAAYVAVTDGHDLFDVGWPTLRDLGWVLAGLGGLFVVGAAISAVLTAIGTETATNEVVTVGEQNPNLFLYLIPVAVLFVGPGEELLFRGVVQGLFRRAYGVVPGIVATSVLFGVAHVVALTGSVSGQVAYMAVAGALGLVLGALYEHTQNLVVPSLVHGLWNAILFGALYVGGL